RDQRRSFQPSPKTRSTMTRPADRGWLLGLAECSRGKLDGVSSAVPGCRPGWPSPWLSVQ
ncbi:MAG: hypothetical protein ACK53L_34885, partial [Pirellulaceae bacterium]